jgi:hypothetical protein
MVGSCNRQLHGGPLGEVNAGIREPLVVYATDSVMLTENGRTLASKRA